MRIKKEMDSEKKYNPPKGTIKHSYLIRTNENVSITIIHLKPLTSCTNIPVVMVTGLATLIESFGKVIEVIVRQNPVFYIETREKSSSVITGNVPYDIENMGLDIANAVNSIGLEERNFIMVGYSFGATVIADCYRFLKQKPTGIIFLEPTPVFHYPAWSIFLIRNFGTKFYSVLKPFAKWYLGKFHINKKEDNEMAVISSHSLDNADPEKLKNAILGIAGYEVWERLEFISCKTMVVGTSKDWLHVKEEVERMVKILKNSSYIDLETNHRTHSPEMGELILQFIQTL